MRFCNSISKGTRFWIALLGILLGSISICSGINEQWRLTNALKSQYGWGYGTFEIFDNYQYCYHPETIYTLDSLSITHWSVIEYETGPTYYLAPFTAEFVVEVGNGSYTVRTAWVNLNSSVPYLREYTRSTNGTWLEDNLLDSEGNILWHKVYDYNSDGSVRAIRLTDYEETNQVSEWLTEITYDATGKRINR